MQGFKVAEFVVPPVIEYPSELVNPPGVSVPLDEESLPPVYDPDPVLLDPVTLSGFLHPLRDQVAKFGDDDLHGRAFYTLPISL